MKTLFEACKPRESVFDETKRDDTLDLSNLLDGSIDGKHFFEETFITEGMELLFDTAFKRFEGKASSGLVKLTQAMGGKNAQYGCTWSPREKQRDKKKYFKW